MKTKILTALALALALTARADTIYVANTLSNSIVKFTANGTGTVFVSTGLNTNLGLAFDGGGNLYVAVWDQSGINHYDAGGQATNFATTDYLSKPTGLAFDRTGNLYMSDYLGNSIVKFDTNGVSTIFASTLDFSLGRPEGLAFDSNGNLYAACYVGFPFGNGGIIVFDTNGVGTVFTTNGVAGPDGIAFDRNGNLYAANFNDNTVVKFDTNGVGSVFATNLFKPDGLAFDSSGNLYVSNFGTNTIMKFDTNAVGTVFASTGLAGPSFLAVGPNISAFAIASVTVTNVGGVPSIRLVWNGLPGSNEIQTSSGTPSGSYSNNFSTVGVQVLPAAGITNYIESGGATNSPARYYRIKAQQAQAQTPAAKVAVPSAKASALPLSIPVAPLQTITVEQAKQHIGETATVRGVVAQATYVTQLPGKPTFLNLDSPYPREKFTVVIHDSDRAKFKFVPELVLSGKTVCVTGSITDYRGLPEIVVEDPSQIVIK